MDVEALRDGAPRAGPSAEAGGAVRRCLLRREAGLPHAMELPGACFGPSELLRRGMVFDTPSLPTDGEKMLSAPRDGVLRAGHFYFERCGSRRWLGLVPETLKLGGPRETPRLYLHPAAPPVLPKTSGAPPIKLR